MEVHWENHLMDLAGEIFHPGAGVHRPAEPADAGLEAAYELSAAITARNSRSFHMASSLLPTSKRRAVRALYAFCRTVDDSVDAGPGEHAGGTLEYWRQVSLGKRGPRDGVAAAWVDVLHRYRIPRRYPLQLIDGVARDLGQPRYQRFDELATYCYAVASTVGLMSMYVVGFDSAQAVPYAIKLGVALQLTNILRDVGEDLEHGRLYLPLDELRAYGLDAEDLPAARAGSEWRRLMQFQIERARQLYAEAWPGIGMLHRDGRLAIAAAARIYAGILDEIERNEYDVFSRRASVSTAGKLARIPPLLFHI